MNLLIPRSAPGVLAVVSASAALPAYTTLTLWPAELTKPQLVSIMIGAATVAWASLRRSRLRYTSPSPWLLLSTAVLSAGLLMLLRTWA